MKHILVYESFEYLPEAAIPVYDEDEFEKDPKAKRDTVSTTNVVSKVEDLLNKQKNGEIKGLTVVADIPSQGKNAPPYLKDVISAERERMAKRKYSLYGSRQERDDRPEDEEYTDEINIFVDSEFIVDGVEKGENPGVFAIPRSFYKKVQLDSSLKNKYLIKITPVQIMEVTYTKA